MGAGERAASGREREDVVGGIGAVGNGRWMSPYGLYALDWCKWPVSNGGYGRVAMCSYAEDSHNYVSFSEFFPSFVLVWVLYFGGEFSMVGGGGLILGGFESSS